MISLFNLDRFAIVGLVLTATMPFIALSPADAAPVDCTVEAQAIEALSLRAEAGGVSSQATARALRTARLAQKICNEGGRHEAAKKFDLARAQLGSDVELADRR
ncbi:hypothetical protein [Polymorphobacter fuscus]|uniref:hypothetical protein n=1 Tax=Sandarakinorhabdus fusca TaxID=1439888 RepID=UPI00142F51E2|nr:hypothetical protein [Polymorphobacter fuscus]NJC10064.1 hypothetical protein [Polymorphobacter fuscus]